ncbi:hypothetical protein AGDE_16399 [Angomonas deanei]|uniref:C2 domain-containing protein n=1 Tax=Angomonas deanei TaxID=59799 RepID=A0A7G2C7S2_9TRYP|nr:hypothetical protein AGDE_16399 [Angomonas deanei]CAD2215154.1 hypothetical protein, conserved [Angomonas deanei]|eukprot:EPY17144.1 hypothetical protein AGDE_16399 [Angomonas deanei]
MPVVDISIIKVFNVTGDKGKKLNVYVRLQGQAMRTSTFSLQRGECNMNERFRFQYDPSRARSDEASNKLYVEVWSKSLMSQSCVSVAVTPLTMPLVMGQPTQMNVHGWFEGKSAAVKLVIRPVDFGLPPQGAPQPYAMMPPQPQGMPQPYMNPSRPAEGIPLEPVADPNPYGTSDYGKPAVPQAVYSNNPNNNNYNANNGGELRKKDEVWAPAPVSANNANNNYNNNNGAPKKKEQPWAPAPVNDNGNRPNYVPQGLYDDGEGEKLPAPNYPSGLYDYE